MDTKVQVIFYSMYGHVYRMAEAVAAGVREVAGVEVRRRNWFPMRFWRRAEPKRLAKRSHMSRWLAWSSYLMPMR